MNELLQTGEIENSLFSERHSLSVRIWHWLLFLGISCTLITVLLASTFFSTGDNITLVQEQIESKGGSVTKIQARAVAHEYNDKLWMLHKYIGYGLSFLLLSRVFIEIFHSKEEKLSAKIKNALNVPGRLFAFSDKSHYLMAKAGYLFFYSIFLVMALTGLGLAFEDVPFLKEIHGPIKSVHSFVQYLIYFYIIAHLIGTVRADVTSHSGIISGMINGNKKANRS
ncbi:MAG: cytochrome b/b6 domain-containing protein [Chitinophagaceae bacterium]